MGFFAPDAEVAPQSKKPAKLQARAAVGCDACALKAVWPSILSPRMKMVGPADADILILGGNLTSPDDIAGKPWADDGGGSKMLKKLIPKHMHDRIAYQSMVRCFPSRLGMDDLHHSQACSIHLTADIERSDIKFILGVGNLAARYFAPGHSLSDIYGTKMPIQIGSKTLWFYPVFEPSYVYSMIGKFDDGNVAPIFNADVRRFFNECYYWPAPRIFKPNPDEVIVPKSYEEAKGLIDRMQGKLGYDIEAGREGHGENSGVLKPMIKDARILTAAFSDGALTIAFPVDHPERAEPWAKRLILDTLRARQWIAHNAGFELLCSLYLAEQMGEQADFNSFDDSMALLRLYHNRHFILSLAAGTKIHLGTDFKSLSKIDAKRILSYPLAEVLPYNGLDAQGSALLVPEMLPRVAGANYDRFIGSVEATARMELMGLNIDYGKSAELRKEWESKAELATKGLRQIYEVKAFEADKGRAFRISAPEDVGEALAVYGKVPLPKTDGGKQYSTDDEILSKLAPDNPLVKAVSASREAAKIISTYIDPVESAAEHYVDRLLHPGYTTLMVATTRLSSNGPNIQNFPKRNQEQRELRKQIIARPGHLFYAFDYGQLEARVIAMCSKDPNLIGSIIKGRDIHTDWLNNCLNIYPDYLERLADMTGETNEKKIRKYGRDIIKTDFVFASFFGSSANSVSNLTKIPRHLVDDLHAEFWKEFAGVLDWIKAKRKEYKETGSTKLLNGIERHTILWGNEPINTPVQGTGACIVVEAMNELSQASVALGDPYFHPRINIHDDLIFELPEDLELAEPYIESIMQTMVEVRFQWQCVPLMVEARMGSNWAELEEFAIHTGDWVK
jgi:DNA polymerase I-like protein with 3'-5' exonuclease and polymerase domains/uracil-DNA glycosylase